MVLPSMQLSLMVSCGMSPALDRRSFIGMCGAALAGASFGAGPSFARAELEQISGFPSMLRGASSVERYPVEGAKQVLVHVRQAHENPIFQALTQGQSNASPRAVACHENIRALLHDLEAQCPCRSMFVEGVARDGIAETREGVRQLSEMLRINDRARHQVDAFRANLRGKQPTSEQAGLLQAMGQAVAAEDLRYAQLCANLDAQSLSLSSAYQVAANYNIEILSPDTPETEKFLKEYFRPVEQLSALNQKVADAKAEASKLIQAVEASGTRKPEEMLAVSQKIESLSKMILAASEEKKQLVQRVERSQQGADAKIFDLREDAVLSLMKERPIAGDKPEPILVLFGAAHDFRDNVARFNKQNPARPISLIVVTPQGL